MRTIDLTGTFAELVTGSRSTIEFKARFWSWLLEQRREGPLVPLLSDMERHWSTVGQAPSLSEARELLRRIAGDHHERRLSEFGRRYREIVGELPDVDVVLLAGLERPEGYSRFDRGRNTIFIGLDHPSNLAHADHLEIILAHEMCHALRDPASAVLADYGGTTDMTHDDFVLRHPFSEHLVSESLATSVSERFQPGRPDRRYVYFEEEAVQWCEAHRREIAERMLLALERSDPYTTFYSEGSVTPDSPDCCDYWFGLHLGRHALTQVPILELLRMPASIFLERHLQPFLDRFLAGAGGPVLAVSRTKLSPKPSSVVVASSRDEALSGASLPSSVRRVYDEYTALLARRPELAAQLDEQFRATLAQERLEYDGQPWDVHAFPLLLSSAEEKHLRWATRGLLQLVERSIDMYRESPEVRAFFRFPPHLEELCLLEPHYRPYVMLGRFDSYWSGRRLRFLELNVGGAALWALADVLGKAALDLPVLGDLLRRHGARASPLTSRVFEGLLSAWHQVRGESSEPRRMAIVDWAGIRGASEQARLAEDFTRMGVPTDVVPPAALAFDGRELCGPAGPIDLVYRRLTTLDVIDHLGKLGPLVDAARCGAVVVVGPFASDVAHSKRLFVFLTHERWQRRFSPEERSLIDAHVPWTRMFVPGVTQFEGRMRDLAELAIAERERFVLKPAEGHDGTDVLLGAGTEPELWASEIRRRYGGDHILQQVVQAPLRRLLLPDGPRVAEVSRWLHLGEFAIAGQLAGFIARASEELVLGAESTEHALPCLTLGDGEQDEEPDRAP